MLFRSGPGRFHCDHRITFSPCHILAGCFFSHSNTYLQKRSVRILSGNCNFLVFLSFVMARAIISLRCRGEQSEFLTGLLSHLGCANPLVVIPVEHHYCFYPSKSSFLLNQPTTAAPIRSQRTIAVGTCRHAPGRVPEGPISSFLFRHKTENYSPSFVSATS